MSCLQFFKSRLPNDGTAWDHFAELERSVKKCEDERRNVGGKITHVLELVRIEELENGKVEVSLIGSNPRVPEFFFGGRSGRLAEVSRIASLESAAKRRTRELEKRKERWGALWSLIEPFKEGSAGNCELPR